MIMASRSSFRSSFSEQRLPEPGRRQDRDADPGDRVRGPGADTTQWQENVLAALRTDAGAELARAVTSSSPQWWAAFDAS
jgi:hypothetical protein